MDNKKTLSQLTYEDLKLTTAWKSIGSYSEDEDSQITPVEFDMEGRIPRKVEEVWCLCTAVFANGTEHLATAMCRGDSSDGPMLWSIWNGNEDIPLLLPPAPTLVLAKKGPAFFSSKFLLKTEDIFPLIIKVVPRFETSPKVRSIRLDISGVILE